MSKRNYYRLNQDPWAWKPVAPETAEEKADRKRREAIAAEKRAKRKKYWKKPRIAIDKEEVRRGACFTFALSLR